DLIDQYLNVHPMHRVMLKAWLGFTLAHPKIEGNYFPNLVLISEPGRGKTRLCRIIAALLDPNAVGVQRFPKDETNLAIAMELSHPALFDNIRAIGDDMSDALCMAATGTAFPSRKLFTNKGRVVLHPHGPLVLNGAHPFIQR